MSKGITNSLEMEEPFYVRRKPDPVPFSKFLYNSDKGTVMGRTGPSWGKHLDTVFIHTASDLANVIREIVFIFFPRLKMCIAITLTQT